MGRRSVRAERQKEIISAFMRVFSEHGYAGATVVAVADEAGLSPGLIHHHFENKDEILDRVLTELVSRFRSGASDDSVEAYVEAALQLGERADTLAARCWVGLFAEAIRNPKLFSRVKRLLTREVELICARSENISEHDASAILSFIVGALVFGAFAPRKAAGFAEPALLKFVQSIGS